MKDKQLILINKKRVLYAMSFAISCLALHCVTKNLYTDVDNYTISVVTNGLYDADNYCIHLHPILCWIIGKLSDIFPQTDVFALLGRVLILGALMWLFYAILKSRQRVIDKTLEILFLLFLSTAFSVWNKNYTVQAAFFMFVGLMMLVREARKKKIGRLNTCIGTVFVCVGIMWRIQAALLFVPFVSLELVVSQICSEKSDVIYCRNVKKIFGSVFLLFLMLVLSRSAVQMSERYNSSVTYDAARVIVQDYPMKEWEKVECELIGISQSEYDSARAWVLLDTEVIDKDLLLRISDVGESTEFEWSLHGLVKGLEKMALTVWRSSKTVWIFLGIFFFIFLYAFLANQSWWRKLECVLVCVGTWIIILYYIMIGRAPLRVWESVIFAAISILAINVIFIDKHFVDKKWFSALKLFIGLVLCVGIIKDVVTADFSMPQLAITSRINVDESVFDETFENESLYFWHSWHANMTRYYMEQGKLPSEKFLQHNLPVGDWIYGQVYFNNHLKELKARNPAKALIERSNTYFISDDASFLLEYLQEHYRKDIEAKQCGEIKNIPIWSFQ